MTAFMALAPVSPSRRDGIAPTLPVQVLNFVVFEAAWFAAVAGAAHGRPLLGTLAVAAAVVWHLAVSARPAREAMLMASLCAIGLVAESARALQGDVRFSSGQPVAVLAPYWMVAMWALLAIALNVTMRWLRHRPWRAALLGAVAGPLSFMAGVRLGAAEFVDMSSAIASLAVMWAVLLPTVMWLSTRFDGVATTTSMHPEARRA